MNMIESLILESNWKNPNPESFYANYKQNLPYIKEVVFSQVMSYYGSV
jgi:hypothetical protein